MNTKATLVSLVAYIFLLGNVCLGQNTNSTSVDREGLTGAVPQEDLIWKRAIACEGQKLYIECPKIYNRIQVQSTFYGREDAVTCKHPELPSDKICADQNVTVKNVVVDLCQGEARCEVAATNDFLAQFGTIICPNVYKYLYIKYRCVPKTALPDAPELSPNDHATSVTSTVTTNYAPVQCCYVVPGVGTSQTATTVGGTIVRHNQGIQSVEERIVSERPQVQQTHKVTEIIHSHPVQIQNRVAQPAKIPLARITLPGVSRLQLNTLIQGGHKVGTHQVTLGSPQIRSNIWGLQKKNTITRPYLPPRNKTYVLLRTTKTKGAGKIGTNTVTTGLSQKRRDIKGLQKSDTTRPLLSQGNKKSFKHTKLKKNWGFRKRVKKTRLKLKRNIV